MSAQGSVYAMTVAEFLRKWAGENKADRQHVLKVVTVWSALVQSSLNGVAPDQATWNARQREFWDLLNRPIAQQSDDRVPPPPSGF